MEFFVPVLDLSLKAPQGDLRASASHQFPWVEGLADVVIRTELEPFGSLIRLCSRRQEDHRSPIRVWVPLHLPTELGSRQPRHHHVGYEKVNRTCSNKLEGVIAIRPLKHCKFSRQNFGDQLAHLRTV